jgi:uncharacterized membrane protein YfcA
MFSLNTGVRLILLLLSGLLLQGAVWLSALYLAPFMICGMLIGHRLHIRLTRAQIARIISVLLVLTGISILSKALLSG